MGYKKGESREQRILFPDTIDDYIEENNPVRFLEAFIEKLDMEELDVKYAKPMYTGRPPYDPKDLLKLYIYGYLNRVRTSRRLEKETHRNIEMMWLLRGVKPDFKTIADFRKNNSTSSHLKLWIKRFKFYSCIFCCELPINTFLFLIS